jgi:hypothetical protein
MHQSVDDLLKKNLVCQKTNSKDGKEGKEGSETCIFSDLIS